MPRKRGNLLPSLLPAPPFPEHHTQYDDTKCSTVKPPTAATHSFDSLDLHALPSCSNLDDSIWKSSHIEATSLQRGNRVEHGVIQVYYYCSLGSHHHPSISLRDHGIPNSYREAGRSPNSTSILCLPLLKRRQLRGNDTNPMSNVPEQLPVADFSTMQTINPVLAFPNTSITTSSPLNEAANVDAAAELCSIPFGTDISSTWFLDQPQWNSQIIHDQTACINDHSLPGCHSYGKQLDHKVEVKDSELDDRELGIHKRKFNCNIIGCRMAFKRQDHLDRHTRSHSKEKPYFCWVPGCHRAFSRRDNLKVHCTKTHARRGGRNRYVATLDDTSPDYDPGFCGQLSFDGHPLRFSEPICSISEAQPQQP